MKIIERTDGKIRRSRKENWLDRSSDGCIVGVDVCVRARNWSVQVGIPLIENAWQGRNQNSLHVLPLDVVWLFQIMSKKENWLHIELVYIEER